MVDEKVKQWIKKKLDSGVSEDRIKKTLEKTGRDPALVEEVVSGGTSDVPEQEGDDLGKEVEDQGFEKDTEEDDNDDDSFDLSYVDQGDEGSSADDKSEESGGSGFGLPSMPSVSAPSVSVPHSRKALSLAVILLLVAGVAYGGIGFLGSGSVADTVSGALETCSGGMGAGVKMYSVGESGGQTMADVYTDERAEMVLEIYSGGQKMGESTKTIDGRGIIRADSVGDRAVFHEVGCEKPNATGSY